MRFREYNQTLTLFKKVEFDGENKVVISSSGWFEHENTVERGEHQYLCMLSTGVLLVIGAPRGANEHGDECVGRRLEVFGVPRSQLIWREHGVKMSFTRREACANRLSRRAASDVCQRQRGNRPCGYGR